MLLCTVSAIGKRWLASSITHRHRHIFDRFQRSRLLGLWIMPSGEATGATSRSLRDRKTYIQYVGTMRSFLTQCQNFQILNTCIFSCSSKSGECTVSPRKSTNSCMTGNLLLTHIVNGVLQDHCLNYQDFPFCIHWNGCQGPKGSKARL